jgi:hypothetical protein
LVYRVVIYAETLTIDVSMLALLPAKTIARQSTVIKRDVSLKVETARC